MGLLTSGPPREFPAFTNAYKWMPALRPAEESQVRKTDDYRGFPGKAWVINCLRMLHLAGVVGVGATLLGGHPACDAFCLLMVGSGVAIIALDVWSNPAYLAQVRGLAMVVKVGLAFYLAFGAEDRVPVFWGILALSVLLSHAPGRIRHRRVFGG